MTVSTLSNLLTLNRSDFVRYAFLTVITPGDVLAGRIP
jgi:hypothetical protein